MEKKKPNCFSTKINLNLKDKLKNDLENQGFTLTNPPHTIFSAKKNKIICTLYESGSLVVQGKEKDQFIEFYLEPEILKDFSYTYPLMNIDLTPRMGVDEAGKGDFFGPLCISGVFANEKEIEELVSIGVIDSKRISDKKVQTLAEKIKKLAHVNICISPKKYNELYKSFQNLNMLLGWAHATVLANLYEKTHIKKAIIDQFAAKSVVLNALKKKNISLDLEQRHKGEEDVVVAAASILARNSFLEGLEKLSDEISINLPKGASSLVIEAGKQIVNSKGIELLDSISKNHFKTRENILSDNPSQ